MGILRGLFGDMHPNVALCLHNLGVAGCKTRIEGSISGRETQESLNDGFDEAIQLLKQALKIRRKVLGGQHRDLAQTMMALGNAYAYVEGRGEEGLEMLEQALAINVRHGGQDSLDCGTLHYLISEAKEGMGGLVQLNSALAHARESARIFQGNVFADPGNPMAERVDLTVKMVARLEGRIVLCVGR